MFILFQECFTFHSLLKNGHTLAGIGASFGLSMNFESVTDRYVDVRLECKKEVLDAYHGALEKADPATAKGAAVLKKGKSISMKKTGKLSCKRRISLLLPTASYMSAQNVDTVWAPLADFKQPKQAKKETLKTHKT